MHNKDRKRIEVPFDPSVGYPFGNNLYYECLKCGVIIPSSPKDCIQCACGNIRIDPDYGRVGVKDSRLMKIFQLA
jgi:hypothetical protein